MIFFLEPDKGFIEKIDLIHFHFFCSKIKILMSTTNPSLLLLTSSCCSFMIPFSASGQFAFGIYFFLFIQAET